MPFRTLRVLLRRRASRTAFPRWSVRNDSLNSVLKLCVGLRGQLIIVRRSASYAFPDAPRPLCDAERRDLHSHAGACGTIISTIVLKHCVGLRGQLIIVRRSASHAFPDAPRPLYDVKRRDLHFPRWSVPNDSLNSVLKLCVGLRGQLIIVRRSASHAFPDAPRPLATQSVENCIPTLERAER
jgi:hypothetical protein